MKIYKNLYWLISSPATLFQAWEVFKTGKRNKSDVSDFEFNLEKNIFDLCRDLKHETYKHGPYKGFWIRDPKLRRINKATVRDRVLHHAIFSVLNPIFESTFTNNSFSCRIGKGTHKGMKEVRNMIRIVSQNNTRPCNTLKCDIRKFFDSVDHDILFDILSKKIKDEKVMALLREIIGSFIADKSNLFERKGIPIGNLTSQIFANIYMNEFDQFVKNTLKVKHYARYTDDFVIISRDKEYLLGLIPLINQFLNNTLKLELHPKKMEIISSTRGVDFLGYVLFPHHILIRKRTKKRMQRKLFLRLDQYQRKTIDKKTLRATLQSYLGALSHANAHIFSENLKNYFLSVD